jgi:hypothetical protein
LRAKRNIYRIRRETIASGIVSRCEMPKNIQRIQKYSSEIFDIGKNCESQRPCPISLDHFPSTYRQWEESAFHVLARFTSARSSLEAASPSSGAYLQSHRRPRVLVTSATSLATRNLPLFDDLHSPSLRVPPSRATAPSPPCRIQMSLFSGPLRSPFTQPYAVTRRRGRGREKDYGGGWARGRWQGGGGSKRGSIRTPPTDTLARMSAPVLSRRLLEQPRLSATR